MPLKVNSISALFISEQSKQCTSGVYNYSAGNSRNKGKAALC